MKTVFQRYAWMLGGVLIALALYLRADVAGDRLGWPLGLLGFGLIGLNALLGFDRRHRTEYLRTVKYGANALVATLVVSAIVGLINVMVYRHYRQWDLTSGGQFTLRPESVKVLAALKVPVEITGFHKAGNRMIRQEFDEIMSKYQRAAPEGMVRYRLVDPDQHPEIAQSFGEEVTYGTIVLKTEIGTGFTDGHSEDKIINSIIVLTRETERTVCYLMGHGERDLTDAANPNGYDTARKITEQVSYFPKVLNLLSVSEIPSACDVVVLAGPSEPFETRSVDVLSRFLDRGGRMLFLLDPELDRPLGLEGFAMRYNLTLSADLVIDPQNQFAGGNPAIPVVETYPPADRDPASPWNLTQGLDLPTFFPLVRSIGRLKPEVNPGIESRPFLSTSDQSYAERDLAGYKQGYQTKDAGDAEGPVVVGCAAVRTVEPESGRKLQQRVAFVGDSDFASNGMAHGGNARLLANLLTWLAADEDLINYALYRPKPHLLSLSARDERILAVVTTYLFPGMSLLIGLAVWRIRRRL